MGADQVTTPTLDAESRDARVVTDPDAQASAETPPAVVAAASTPEVTMPGDPTVDPASSRSPLDPASSRSPLDHTVVDAGGATETFLPADRADLPAPRGRRPSRAPLPPPLSRIGQFVLLERLGAGGMGVVYAAFDEQLERKVAIKLVTHDRSERAHARLLREAQAQARLTHPHIVTVYEVGTLPEGQLFIAMELVKGDTLRVWQSEPRQWRDIVALYAAAGEGLAAAHRGGIVHRDFKPDNVLIGDDGRARVADFGLAFAAEMLDSTPSFQGVRPSDSRPSQPQMHTIGAIAGTPGYMAPEQLTGGVLDARTDQFGFAVALYEALHGERPFADYAFLDGERPAPRRTEPDPSYPRWLWDVVMRGLAYEPDARFPSMDALVAELTRNRGRTRRRVLAGVAIAGALVIAGITSASVAGGRVPLPCPRANAELAGVWDPMTKLRIGGALLAAAPSYAATTWSSTAVALDRYADRWLDGHQSACEATHVRHVQSAELLDRRMECLAQRRRALTAATEVLETRPAQAIGRASELLASLGDIDLCADTGALLALPRITGGPSAATAVTRAVIGEARQRLARAGALLATGDIAGAAPVVADAAQLTKDLDFPPIRAEIQFLDSRVKIARGDVADAIAAFHRAAELALASGHDELSADIWLTLAVSGSSRELKPAEIEEWLNQGEAWVRRLGHASDPRWIDVEYARGKLQLIAGAAREAQTTMTRALEAAEKQWGDSDPRLIPLLRDRAAVHRQLRQANPAVADAERALNLGIAAWGSEYPDIARTRRLLGLIYIELLGDIDRGEAQILLALQQYTAQLGADSLEVANCEHALLQVGQYRGDYAAALHHAERAEQIYAARLGADHPRRGEALMAIGVLRMMRRDFAGALAANQAAVPIMRTALGAQHIAVGALRSNTGEALLGLGRPEQAKIELEQGLAILEHSLGPDHANLASPLKGLGLANLALGKPGDALPRLERALALCSAAHDPTEVAEIRWGLARALRSVGRDPSRARSLAEQALVGFRNLGAESAVLVQDITRWLGNLP